jgi:hypothetical protein
METTTFTTGNMPYTTQRAIAKPQKPVTTKTARVLDAHYISLTKQILAGMKPSLKFEEVEDALASGRVSSNVIDDLEDAMFGAIMIERSDDDNESVSIDEIFKVLRQR